MTSLAWLNGVHGVETLYLVLPESSDTLSTRAVRIDHPTLEESGEALGGSDEETSLDEILTGDKIGSSTCSGQQRDERMMNWKRGGMTASTRRCLPCVQTRFPKSILSLLLPWPALPLGTKERLGYGNQKERVGTLGNQC